MDTYLIKNENGQTYHFRAEVGEHWVSVTEGIFYNWLSKHSLGCGDHDSAIKKQQEMIEQRLQEGFQITPFTKTPENSVDVYDKAKWHFSGDFPAELTPFQGYVHTGLFLGWLIDKNLMSEEFSEDSDEVFSLFRERQITGPKIFETYLDGTLMLEDLSEAGNRFALHYFDFTNGNYLEDYEHTLSKGLPSMYHVEDSWENYDKLKIILDKRYAASR